jgi:hypothetical protein
MWVRILLTWFLVFLWDWASILSRLLQDVRTTWSVSDFLAVCSFVHDRHFMHDWTEGRKVFLKKNTDTVIVNSEPRKILQSNQDARGFLDCPTDCRILSVARGWLNMRSQLQSQSQSRSPSSAGTNSPPKPDRLSDIHRLGRTLFNSQNRSDLTFYRIYRAVGDKMLVIPSNLCNTLCRPRGSLSSVKGPHSARETLNSCDVIHWMNFSRCFSILAIFSVITHFHSSVQCWFQFQFQFEVEL